MAPGIYTDLIRRTVTISKLGHDRRFIFSWKGLVLEETPDRLLIRASWDRDVPMFLGYTVFEPGDPFQETYYREKWFSIWRVGSHRNGRIKGWYCNVCQPIEIDGDDIRFVDMELDLFLFPDGRYAVLDEDDLDRADLPERQKDQARAGLAEVIGWIERREPPFENVGPPRRIEAFW